MTIGTDLFGHALDFADLPPAERAERLYELGDLAAPGPDRRRFYQLAAAAQCKADSIRQASIDLEIEVERRRALHLHAARGASPGHGKGPSAANAGAP